MSYRTLVKREVLGIGFIPDAGHILHLLFSAKFDYSVKVEGMTFNQAMQIITAAGHYDATGHEFRQTTERTRHNIENLRWQYGKNYGSNSALNTSTTRRRS